MNDILTAKNYDLKRQRLKFLVEKDYTVIEIDNNGVVSQALNFILNHECNSNHNY